MGNMRSSSFMFAGRYECIKQIGVGGFSRVFLAKDHEQGGIQVAIKIYQAPEVRPIDDAERETVERTRQRFCQEADVLFQLNSPYIVQAFHTGVSKDDIPYIVMEHIQGETLTERLRRGPVEFKDILLWTKMILEGLQVAHSQGILHRDLTPRNVMLTRVGGETTIKIIDFGIARSESTFSDGPWTQIGTPLYCSPEQLTGDSLSFASDVYSVGLLLHKMLIGQVPHVSRDGAAVIYSRAYEDVPSPNAKGHMLSSDVESFLMKSLEREPAKRYGSSSEMLNAFMPLFHRYCLQGNESDPGEETFLDLMPPVASMMTWAKMHQASCLLDQEDKTEATPIPRPSPLAARGLRPRHIAQAQVSTLIIPSVPVQQVIDLASPCEQTIRQSHRKQSGRSAPIRVERSSREGLPVVVGQPQEPKVICTPRSKSEHGYLWRIWSVFQFWFKNTFSTVSAGK